MSSELHVYCNYIQECTTVQLFISAPALAANQHKEFSNESL